MELEILLNPVNNFINEECVKKFIILGDTLRGNFEKYIKSLTLKDNAPCFIVKKDGTIHKLYGENFYSKLIHEDSVNKASIFIFLENAGKLSEIDTLKYTNWCNDNIPYTDVISIKENNEEIFYEKYPEKQIKNLAYLLIYLSNKFNIQIEPLSNNSKDQNIIMLKSIDIFSNSLNPTFDINLLNEFMFTF